MNSGNVSLLGVVTELLQISCGSGHVYSCLQSASLLRLYEAEFNEYATMKATFLKNAEHRYRTHAARAEGVERSI